MQLIFKLSAENSVYLPTGYFENEIVFDCVKLLENVILQSFFFLQPENIDMVISYDYAPEADSSCSPLVKVEFKKSFVEPRAVMWCLYALDFKWEGPPGDSFPVNESSSAQDVAYSGAPLHFTVLVQGDIFLY